MITLKNVLAQSKSPWMASEAILALGEHNDPQAVPVLADLLLGAKQANNVAAYAALVEHDSEIARAIGNTRIPVQQLDQIKMTYQKHTSWRDFGPNGQLRTSPPVMVIRVGAEKVYLSILRASAAIALGHFRDPAATKALADSLAFRDDGYVQTFKGFAMMSLAEIGDPAALPPLMAYLGRAHPGGKVKSVPELGSPLRGFAALALGLYSRPRAAPLQAGDPADYDKVCLALAERLADTDEELEVRTACAMGLGLTGRTENLRYLQKASDTVRTTDDLLGGYVLLARAMLGDRNILPLAKRYLDVAREKKDTGGILARRAAVLGLAMLDSQDAIPTLLEAWHLTYYVNREVAVALGLLAAYNVTDPLARLLESSPNALEQAFAARCLGELFLEERPYRLRWLLNGNNYTLKNVRMLPFQSTANEFLYEYLIPCFGDEWL
jgi:HEAT repeat protein